MMSRCICTISCIKLPMTYEYRTLFMTSIFPYLVCDCLIYMENLRATSKSVLIMLQCSCYND